MENNHKKVYLTGGGGELKSIVVKFKINFFLTLLLTKFVF